MKIWSDYCKEMKIASRGFYFYMEILVALIMLAFLLLLVPTVPNSPLKEVLFMDIPVEQSMQLFQNEIDKGSIKQIEEKEIKLKPTTITYYDEITGEEFVKIYEDKKTVSLDSYQSFDSETGSLTKTIYLVENFDDLLRIIEGEKYMGSVMWYGDDGLEYFKTILFGTETKRYQNIVSAVHGAIDAKTLKEKVDGQNIRFLETQETLNFRQNMIPLVVVMMNGAMGMMILVAYICIDKSEGLIKAFSVTPSKMSHYLSSKILVALTTSLLSTLLIVIPVMLGQPNYLLFILTSLSLTTLSCTIGLVIASYFKDLKSSFGAIMLVILIFMLPTLSHFLPSFSPLWMKAVPSYYMVEAIKETLLVSCDVSYVLFSNFGMLLVAALCFMISNKRYKKILTR